MDNDVTSHAVALGGEMANLFTEPSSGLSGGVLVNLDEFDEATVAGWAAGRGGSWPAPSTTLTGTGGCSPAPDARRQSEHGDDTARHRGFPVRATGGAELPAAGRRAVRLDHR